MSACGCRSHQSVQRVGLNHFKDLQPFFLLIVICFLHGAFEPGCVCLPNSHVGDLHPVIKHFALFFLSTSINRVLREIFEQILCIYSICWIAHAHNSLTLHLNAHKRLHHPISLLTYCHDSHSPNQDTLLVAELF